MTRCPHCKEFFQPLGLPSHRMACQRKKKNGGLTPKQVVLKRYPDAELARDGMIGNSFFDFAVFLSKESAFCLATGPTAQIAWEEAARKVRK